MPRFSDDEIRRYSRQILLREVGGRGQTRLAAARPVLFCPGAVGQVAAEYLWRAGVTALELLAPDAGAAARLTEQLTAAGYPGAPAQAISAATAPSQSLVSAAPGFTLLWLPHEDPQAKDAATLLWAGGGDTWGAIGAGPAALHATVADPASGAALGGESGPGAMIIGSALALFAMQKILAIAPAVAAQPAAVWRIDLTTAELPGWR